MPSGSVSFERKVLPLENHSLCMSYPNADFWSSSLIPLSWFEVKMVTITIIINNNSKNNKKGEQMYFSSKPKSQLHDTND